MGKNVKKVFDDETLAFLEGVDSAVADKKYDLDLLEEAGRYGADLGSLEEMNSIQRFDAIEQKKSNKHRDKKLKYNIPKFLEDIDVRLSDVIDKVFRKADRPVIVIYDDRIEYANDTFVKFLGLKHLEDVIKKKFLNFVAKEDWNVLASNIGEMLTAGKTVSVGVRMSNNRVQKMNFSAIYLNNSQHFSFILVGEKLLDKVNLFSGLYDNVTGLPSFYLLEDRVQFAVNNEFCRSELEKKSMIALLGIGIDNYKDLVAAGVDAVILQKIASKLVLSMPKNYTIAAGLKYKFWVLMPGIKDEEVLRQEIKKVKNIFDETITDNFAEYNVVTSIGGSLFPDPATNAKKLIEQTILAVQKAQKDGGNRVVVFGS